MNGLIIFSLAILGLCLGSFVNALVWRIFKQNELLDSDPMAQNKKQREEMSVVTGRSMCTHCKHRLSALDLVPVFSWLWLKGRCRYCKEVIEDTPIPELAVPLVIIVSFLVWPFGFELIGVMLFAIWTIVCVCFTALAVYDAKWFLLPDVIVFSLQGLAVMFAAIRLFETSDLAGSAIQIVLALVVLPGFFWLIYKLSDGKWIGYGDIKLAIALAFLVGSMFGAVIVLFIASFAGILFAIPQIVHGSKGLETKIPFGPFLILGTIVAVLLADAVYKNILGIGIQ